jgi:hypothetical protein
VERRVTAVLHQVVESTILAAQSFDAKHTAKMCYRHTNNRKCSDTLEEHELRRDERRVALALVIDSDYARALHINNFVFFKKKKSTTTTQQSNSIQIQTILSLLLYI